MTRTIKHGIHKAKHSAGYIQCYHTSYEVKIINANIKHTIRRNKIIQGGLAKVRPTLLVTFECVGKIQ